MCFISVKLNGARLVTGILRGFDPFMNLVMDEAIETTKQGEQHNIGMVVSSMCIHKAVSDISEYLGLDQFGKKKTPGKTCSCHLI